MPVSSARLSKGGAQRRWRPDSESDDSVQNDKSGHRYRKFAVPKDQGTPARGLVRHAIMASVGGVLGTLTPELTRAEAMLCMSHILVVDDDSDVRSGHNFWLIRPYPFPGTPWRPRVL